MSEAPPVAAPPAKKAKAPRVFAALVVLAALAATSLWLFGRGKESTDDAQVEGRIVSVSARSRGRSRRCW